ncbi:methyl-accepting chemotaxis protein [Enterobacter bugandensis]|uniref:methyl-accepting chemotaxis protein n=1 Tax=Enterobacter TaxID=547 RepID=UPI000669989D|nr:MULTISPECIES: methyl-accepting chemotaxis protein [Enterobacter]MCK6911916.1 methyl-accepting chemotaxis protein [Enterobacter roggenkampii]MCK7068251.1 methyl-accepting chemotaxis protein [Enterobacter bugandensis]MEB6514799.1 methyl-accepting chemotaxis protein [Enterobacter roggenkampii]
MFKNLNISTRLTMAFGVIVVLMTVVCGLLYMSFDRVTAVSKLNVHSYKVVDNLRTVTENLINMETGIRGFALTGKQDILQPFSEGDEAFRRGVSELLTLTSDNQSQQNKFLKISQLEDEWKNSFALPLIQNRNEVTKGALNMDSFISGLEHNSGKAQMDRIRDVINEALRDEYSIMSERQARLADERFKTRMMIVIGLLAAAVTALLAGTLLSRSILNPLKHAVNTADTIASGDLTSVITIDRMDETGKLLMALDNMQQRLKSLVTEIKITASSVDLAAGEIEQGNMELSSRTEEQAAALQQTAASMEQLTMTVRNNTEIAEHTAMSARKTEELAREGESAVGEMSETMQKISANALKIKEITSVIEGIAFQTNILALNAAVEAARAGEHGRGFAVVATEVRNLAQRSASASKEIGSLIENAVDNVDNGVSVASKTAETILRAATNVASLAQSMDSLSMASVEQMQGIMQISTAVTQMDGVTQGNAALVEQSAAASQSLSEQSRSLKQMTDNFVI